MSSPKRPGRSSSSRPPKGSQRSSRSTKPRFSQTKGPVPKPKLKPQRSTGVALPVQRQPAPAPPEEETDTDLIFGRHAVLSALESQQTLNRIWILPQLRYSAKFLPLLQEAKGRGTVIDEVSPERLSRMVRGGNHQGVVAQGTPYAYAELEALVDQALAASRHPVLIVADGVQDPHNLGAIARTGEAMGTQGLIIPQRRAVGVTSSVVKVAAGALSTFPITRVINLNRALEYLKERGFWIYGTETRAQKPLYEVAFRGPVALVVGAEGQGISLMTQQHCDLLVSIPLVGKTESLNASVATGMALYEILRQRWSRTIERSSDSRSQ